MKINKTNTIMSKESDLYTDAASFGRIVTAIGLVIGILFGGAILVYGIYTIMANKQNVHSAHEDAQIKSCKCTTHVVDSKVMYKCNLIIQTSKGAFPFNIDSVTNYQSVDSISVYYDPQNPSDISMTSTQINASVLIGFGLFIIFIAWLSFYLSRRFKFYAAATGAKTLWKIV